ncbi:MAG TPA: dockerin type I repeat-containing protein [Tepidisphaeraceae bacterium]|jgi:autotransporter-associated beta strand protein|nr:dockerin type I repeat-containing protein [Tepidisphaeraceae bacterium]
MHRTHRSTRSILTTAITITLLTAAHARAGTDGAWTGASDNNWSNPLNWAATIADGADGNATFAADLNGDQTVTVDTARTIGNLSFSDLDPSTAGNWVVNSPGPLTLAVSSGTPTITANSLYPGNPTAVPVIPASFVQINVPLAGTQGIQIAGSSTVVSTGINTFTGGLTIPAGSTFSGSGDFLAGATNTLTDNGAFLLRSPSTVNKVIANLTGSGTIGLDANATAGGGLRIKAGSFSGNISDGNATGLHLAIVLDSTAGLLDLSGVNTYTGDTLVRNNGTLRLSSSSALPISSYLRLEPGAGILGTVELNFGGDFSRLLGPSIVTSGVTTGGTNFGAGTDGFGTLGQDRNITFTDGTNPITLKWGTGGFSPTIFFLGSPTSTNTTTLTNSIDLNGAARTLQAGAGAADVDANYAGQIFNSSATAAPLTLGGTGTMLLSADNSSYINNIIIGNPVVRLASANSLGSPTTGTVTINGQAAGVGRLELTGGLTITKPISLQGRAPGASSLAPAISGASGNNTLAGTISTFSGGNLYNFSAEAGTLTIAGTLSNTQTTDRFYQFMGSAGQGFVTTNITNGSGQVDVEKFGNSTWTFSGVNNTYTGTTKVHAGTLALASSLTTSSSFTVDSGAILAVTPGANKTIKTSTLTLTGTAQLDLADNKLALTATSLDTIRPLLLSARATGNWSGPGLTSSSAAAQPNLITAIGYASASDLNISSWGTTSVNPTDTIAKYTYYGDANLDGKINADDYALLDRGFAQQPADPHWTNGDFNYDGIVNSADYLLIDKSFALQSGTLSPTFLAERESQFGDAYVTQLLTSIPEPSLLAASGLALPLLSRRRQIPINK